MFGSFVTDNEWVRVLGLMYFCGRNLLERDTNEVSAVHEWVWECERWGLHNALLVVAVEVLQQVNIYGAVVVIWQAISALCVCRRGAFLSAS